MRKIFAILTALLLVSCSMNHDEVVVATSKSPISDNLEEQARQIVLNTLNKVDPITRSSVRTINRIETITYEQLYGPITRSDSTILGGFSPHLNVNRHELPVLQIAIFDNNSGYAVLTPLFDENDRKDADEDDDTGDSTTNTPIKLIALVDSGTITSEDITAYTNNSTTPEDNATPADRYNEEDEDFLVGGSDANLFVAGLISTYTYNKVANPEDEAVYNDVEDIADDNKVGPLLKTKWWQTNPFNYYFDTMALADNKRYAGCTTIAIAQWLTYLKNRSLSFYFNIPSTTTWTQIENEVFSSSTTSSNINETERYTASMIKQIADDMGVVYLGNKGTMASSAKAKKYLENHLGYSVDKDNGGRNAARLRKIVNSLNNNKPVFISAISGLVEGHSWIIDGYMKNENTENGCQDYLVHCNFGWGGSNDGWYFLNVLDSSKNNNDLLDPGYKESEDFKYSWLFRYLFL